MKRRVFRRLKHRKPKSTTTDGDISRVAMRVGRRLLAAGKRVATAESCTGGWVSKAITDIAGSSEWFSEGFVTYSNAAKERHLGVPRKLLARHGAVSRATARAMALGALSQSDAHIAVAVTGIAGPGGGVPGKPVGTVWLAWAYRSHGSTRTMVQLKRFRGDREAVRRKTVRVALQGLIQIPGLRQVSQTAVFIQ